MAYAHGLDARAYAIRPYDNLRALDHGLTEATLDAKVCYGKKKMGRKEADTWKPMR